MTTVHDVHLDDEFEQGAQGGPTFLTTIVVMGSGQEQANIEWQRAKMRWRIGYGVMNKVGFQSILNFFYARRGRAYGFLFKDWSDFEATDEYQGTGDSTTGSDGTRDYQLIKTYQDAAGSYVRKITRPISSTLVVKVDGVTSANYTLLSGGVVRFSNPHRPTTGQVVTASYEFDVPVRFNNDQAQVQVTWEDAAALPDFEVVEVLE